MKKGKIKRVIFAYIYSFVFGLMVAIYFPSYFQQQKIIENEILERAKSLTNNLALNSKAAMAINDRDALYTLGDSLMSEKDILWVLVLDLNQQVIVKTGTVDFDDLIKRVKEMPADEGTKSKKIKLKNGQSAFDIYTSIKKVAEVQSSDAINKELELLGDFGQMSTSANETTVSFLGTIHVGMSMMRLKAARRATAVQSLMVCFLALIASTVVGRYFANNLLTPIKQFILRLKDIASKEGDLTQRVPIEREDEFGEMAEYFNKFMDNILRIVSKTVKLVKKINISLEDISSTAEELNANADGVNTTVQKVTEDLEKQEHESTDTHNTIEQVLGTLLEITRKSQEAYRVSAETETASRDSKKEVEETEKSMESISDKMNLVETRMDRLNESVSGIGEFLEAIHSIAAQTNLLSLNAAIEAARAGEAGRGFSVVAEEVRKLAENSSSASGKIQKLIEKIQEEVEGTNQATKQGIEVVGQGFQNVKSTGKALQTIMQKAEHSSGVSEDISKSLGEQSEYLRQMINKVENVKALVKNNFQAVQLLSSSVEEQTASFEQITTAIQELSEDAQSTHELIVEFKIN